MLRHQLADAGLPRRGRTFDAKQKVRRHEQRLDTDDEPFVERSFVGLRPTRERGVLFDLSDGDWPAERVATFADLFAEFNSSVDALIRNDAAATPRENA